MGGTWEDACAAWWIVAPTDQGQGPRVGGSRTAEERGEAVGGLRGAEARASWHQREAADRTGPGQGGCGGRGGEGESALEAIGGHGPAASAPMGLCVPGSGLSPVWQGAGGQQGVGLDRGVPPCRVRVCLPRLALNQWEKGRGREGG